MCVLEWQIHCFSHFPTVCVPDLHLGLGLAGHLWFLCCASLRLLQHVDHMCRHEVSHRQSHLYWQHLCGCEAVRWVIRGWNRIQPWCFVQSNLHWSAIKPLACCLLERVKTGAIRVYLRSLRDSWRKCALRNSKWDAKYYCARFNVKYRQLKKNEYVVRQI